MLRFGELTVETRSKTRESCGSDDLIAEARTMTKPVAVTCLFLDIGGVLLTNGWDRHARARATTHFALDLAELEERHHLMFETYEVGKFTLEEYLARVVFYQRRTFTPDQFRRFMFAQSKPYPEMIDLVARLKVRHGLKIAVVSNEARELNLYRIRKFKLAGLVDAFISSSFVHLRKPDADIFRLALDVTQVSPRHVVFVDNTPMFVALAEDMGIRGVIHTDHRSTRAKLAVLGLPSDEGVIHDTS